MKPSDLRRYSDADQCCHGDKVHILKAGLVSGQGCGMVRYRSPRPWQ